MNGCGSRLLMFTLAFGLLCAAALAPSRAEDKPARVPTTHYVDTVRHIELDVPLSWERKFSEDEYTRFIFATGGKSAAGAQAPEFTIVTVVPDANPEALKSLPSFKKVATAVWTKVEKDEETKVDGEKAASFVATKKPPAAPAKGLHVMTIHDSVGYLIVFQCDPATFDAELKSVRPVIDSIKWGK